MTQGWSESEKLRSSCALGSATFMMVASRTTMSWDRPMASMDHHRRDARSGDCTCELLAGACCVVVAVSMNLCFLRTVGPFHRNSCSNTISLRGTAIPKQCLPGYNEMDHKILKARYE